MRDVVGMAFAINGEVNTAEIYASAGLFRKLVSDAGVLWINRGSGAIILVFGTMLLASLIGKGR